MNYSGYCTWKLTTRTRAFSKFISLFRPFCPCSCFYPHYYLFVKMYRITKENSLQIQLETIIVYFILAFYSLYSLQFISFSLYLVKMPHFVFIHSDELLCFVSILMKSFSYLFIIILSYPFTINTFNKQIE